MDKAGLLVADADGHRHPHQGVAGSAEGNRVPAGRHDGVDGVPPRRRQARHRPQRQVGRQEALPRLHVHHRRHEPDLHLHPAEAVREPRAGVERAEPREGAPGRREGRRRQGRRRQGSPPRRPPPSARASRPSAASASGSRPSAWRRRRRPPRRPPPSAPPPRRLPRTRPRPSASRRVRRTRRSTGSCRRSSARSAARARSTPRRPATGDGEREPLLAAARRARSAPRSR